MRVRQASQRAAGLLLAALVPAVAAWAEDAPRPVATFGTTTIFSTELDAKAHAQLFQLRVQEYETRLRVLNSMIAQELLENAATARKVSTEELVRLEVLEKAAPVTPEEIQAGYEQVKGRMPPDRSESDAKAQIEGDLKARHTSERRQAFLNELKTKANVQILLDPPRLDVDASGGVARGPEAAPVTIVEFSDFQCPYCVRAAPIVDKVVTTYGDRVRFVYRDLPLPIHPFAIKASEAAACAGEQGRFWEMHDRLFKAEGKLSVPELKRYAGELKLDSQAFDACLDSGRTAERWQAGKQAAERYGVTGTPVFFINGRLLSGARSFDTFAEIIDDELARSARAKAGEKPKPAAN